VVVTATNPLAPAEIPAYPTTALSCDLAVAGDHVYLADGLGGLLILRVALP
jgi:hypothetical protein